MVVEVAFVVSSVVFWADFLVVSVDTADFPFVVPKDDPLPPASAIKPKHKLNK